MCWFDVIEEVPALIIASSHQLYLSRMATRQEITGKVEARNK